MKRTSIMKYFLLVYLFLIFSVANIAEATVGGPTIISDFKYSPEDQSVYFTQHDFGGRGCPPILKKISLISEETEIFFSCEEGESLISESDSWSSRVGLVYQEIEKITGSLKLLIPISLPNNNLEIDIKYKDKEYLSDEFVIKTNFTADIYQDKVKVDEVAFAGCDIDQPFLFQAFAIPGYEQKIILLLSSVGDCFEGGYIFEQLFVIENVRGLDKTMSPLVGTGPAKMQEVLLPNEGTLLVYENQSVDLGGNSGVEESNNTADDNTDNSADNNSVDTEGGSEFSISSTDDVRFKNILAVVAILFFGILIGRWWGSIKNAGV